MNIFQHIAQPVLQVGKAWDLVRVMLKEGRKCIVTPESDPALSLEENYMRQFETRLAFDGDMLYMIPKFETYPNMEAWEEQLQIHRQKIAAWQEEVGEFDHLFGGLATVFSGLGFWASAELVFDTYDWKSIAMSLGLFALQYFQRKFLMKIILKAVGAIFKAKTGLGEKIKQWF